MGKEEFIRFRPPFPEALALFNILFVHSEFKFYSIMQ